jgi:hypothetical protein
VALSSLAHKGCRETDALPVSIPHLFFSLYASLAVNRAKPKHPILIMSNKHDPMTSLNNALEMFQKGFARGDAGLVVREGFGVSFVPLSLGFVPIFIIAWHRYDEFAGRLNALHLKEKKS